MLSQNDKVMTMINDSMIGMQERIDKSSHSLNERLDNAAKVIGSVRHELGGMKEIGRSIQDFQAFLKSPKLRGNLGEQILYDTISQVFSQEQYSTQYKFREGQIVDAIIKTSGGIIPVDSKFPMENYQQVLSAQNEQDQGLAMREFINAVRKHIRDVSTKYILPEEGTVDFAVMYVPSEGIFHEMLTTYHDEVVGYAQQQRILLVSPHTFFQFLRTIMMGLERAKLEEQAKKIWELLKGVQQETSKFSEKISVLNRHVTNAKNQMDLVSNDYAKLAGRVDQIKLLD